MTLRKIANFALGMRLEWKKLSHKNVFLLMMFVCMPKRYDRPAWKEIYQEGEAKAK